MSPVAKAIGRNVFGMLVLSKVHKTILKSFYTQLVPKYLHFDGQ